MNKKRKEQLENLLDWEKEKRLPETKELFNRQISPTLFLSEVSNKLWRLEVTELNEIGNIKKHESILISHATLIQLGLSILEAVAIADDRF